MVDHVHARKPCWEVRSKHICLRDICLMLLVLALNCYIQEAKFSHPHKLISVDFTISHSNQKLIESLKRCCWAAIIFPHDSIHPELVVRGAHFKHPTP